MCQPRRVVYTCLFGHSERFNDFYFEPDPTIDFICFTDDPELRSDFWRVEPVRRGALDATRASKKVKIKAHQFLNEYAESLYVDNVVRLKQHPREIFARFLEASPSPLVCFRHPWRACVYEEAQAVLELGFDDPARVNAQVDLYRRMRYPPGRGLTKNSFILRRHNEPVVIELMETWFEQVLRHSFRDQLSFMVATWLHQFEPGLIELDFLNNDLLEWPYPKDAIRVPRDFDDGRYLSLHPDVEAGNMDPRKHYLLYGAAEGRRYK